MSSTSFPARLHPPRFKPLGRRDGFNGLVPLIEHGATLEDLTPLYYDKSHREHFTRDIKDSEVAKFWHKEYPSYNDRYRQDAQGPILNKIGQVLAPPPTDTPAAQKAIRIADAHFQSALNTDAITEIPLFLPLQQNN